MFTLWFSNTLASQSLQTYEKKTYLKFYSFFQIMNFTELLNMWAAATPASCSYCFTITCPQSTRLKVSKMNEITIPIEGDLATQFLLQVHHHNWGNKPWRVASEYLFLNENTRSISIPILTAYERVLRRNEPICHFTLILPNHGLQNIRGKLNFFIWKYIL